MKKIIAGIYTILLLFVYTTSIFSASSTFSLYPSSGYVKSGSEFTVDIKIDTEGEKVMLARAVLTFDPKMVKVTEAQYNASLFCTYPDSQQSIDNTNGVIVLTGFCQSGVGDPYQTSGASDVFGRVTFQVKKTGKVKIDWEYSGSDQEFKSIIMKDGSPTTVSLDSKPSSVTFTSTLTGGPGSGETPSTGIFASWTMIVLGIVLVIAGIVVSYMSLRGKLNGKMRTVIIND